MRLFVKSVLLLSFVVLFSCVSRSATAASIAIAPGLTVIVTGQSLQFKATVVGLPTSTVTWQVNGVTGGNATLGTISTTGLYKAPATVASKRQMSITALGSDGATKGATAVQVGPVGPSISAVVPNPIAPGKYLISLHGAGFASGAVVRNGAINLATTYVSPTQLTATGEQASTASGVFQVENPTTAFGPAITVPFKAQGTATTISPATVYIHIGTSQQFTSSTANYWTATGGQVSQIGIFVAPTVMPASNAATVTATGPGGSATASITLVTGPAAIISPATVSVSLGQHQQFTSAGAATWSAQYGTISTAGLYTAPTVWPASGGDVIRVNGTRGSASARVTIPAPLPAITAVGTQGLISLGVFTVTVTGTGFSANSVAELAGAPLATTYSSGQLTVVGFCGRAGPSTMTVMNGSARSAPFPVQIGVANPKVSPAAARRFLEQAAFGPSPADAAHVQALGFAGWINEQLAMPQVSSYKSVTGTYDGMPEQFMTNAVTEPDQLRQRVGFALSEIFVTSLFEVPNQTMVTYQDMLLADSFTNYQQIMSDVTLSPAMGQYLNMANNAKANPAIGSLANENFAREMMQLFTLGTNLLNQDGSLQVDSNGIPVPTYSQFQVTEFARVYTGWTYAPASGHAVQWVDNVSNYGPMMPYPDQHDAGSKQLLNGYVSQAGISPARDVDNAIANIFSHPNIAPFVSKQLIQHLVKSNPSPAYISRVAAAFINNGSGVRGDMKAVLTAILLDPEARANDEGGDDQPADGHLQEPALFFPAMYRAFNGHMDDSNHYAWYLSTVSENLFSSPSVFNYYAPSFAVPGTSLEGGEFQIDSPNNAVLRANLVTGLFGASTALQSAGPGTSVDLSPFIPLASNPTTLVNALDLTLTHGVMPAEMKQTIITAAAGETQSNLRRVQRAVYLILTSSYYNVWH